MFPGHAFYEKKEVREMMPDIRPSKTPNLTLHHIHGKIEDKPEIFDAIHQFKFPEAYENAAPVHAILFHGEPGCGKTTTAKAMIGTLKEQGFNTTFYHIKGSQIKNPFVGMSGKIADNIVAKVRSAGSMGFLQKYTHRIKRLLGLTKEVKPRNKNIGVLLIDEIDALLLNRDKDDRAGNTNLVLITALLNDLDRDNEANKGKNILILGTTNKPHLVDTAADREGRFAKVKLENPLSEGERSRYIEFFLRKKIEKGETFTDEAKNFLSDSLAHSENTGGFSVSALKEILEKAVRIKGREIIKKQRNANQIEKEDVKKALRELKNRKGKGKKEEITIEIEEKPRSKRARTNSFLIQKREYVT